MYKRQIVGVAAALVVLAVGMAYGRPFAPLLLLAISLAISVIPEGLPATATIVMALGVQRLSLIHISCSRIASKTEGRLSAVCSNRARVLSAHSALRLMEDIRARCV